MFINKCIIPIIMKKNTKGLLVVFVLVFVIIIVVLVLTNREKLFAEKVDSDFTVSYEGIETGNIPAGVGVHDPSIVQEGDTYYIFGSHMAVAKTNDLRKWTWVDNGYRANNSVYDNIFEEGLGIFDYAGSGESIIPTDDGGHHVWAPDVIYNEANQKYYMYISISSTWNASNICYATSDNIDGPYVYQGPLIYSGFTQGNIEHTDVLDYVDEEYARENYMTAGGSGYNYKRFPNAIDPTVFYDEDGRLWMVYGSWSGGMFLIELDEETGQVIHPDKDEAKRVDPYFGKNLFGGDHKSMEGPYILYDEDNGYYYLYLSYGGLARDGGYQMRVYRSETVDGDYVDMNGEFPTSRDNHANFGLKLSGNYYLPSLEKGYKATGHNSVFIDKNDGKTYNVFHTRFDNKTEHHQPRVNQIILNEQGWPCMLPYATSGETVSETGYKKDQVVGEYYFINQGKKIDSLVVEPIKLVLTKRGNVYGEDIEGTWEMKDNSYFMTITYNEQEYSGVFCEMEDEAGTSVMTFSAVANNESVWGVKYE